MFAASTTINKVKNYCSSSSSDDDNQVNPPDGDNEGNDTNKQS